MTVASEVARSSYAGNGATVAFSTGFAFQQNADVRVILVAAAGGETTWTENVEYTLTGAGTGAAGTVTAKTTPTNYTPQTGDTLVILRDVAFTQSLDANVLDTMAAADVEAALDKLWHGLQQLREIADRSVQSSPGAGGVPSVSAWSPTWAIENDSDRRVLKLVDWVGGLGTPKPASPFYIGALGLVTQIANAVDIRGPQGASGAGTGDVLAANNLSDLANLATAWNNLLTAKTAKAARAGGAGGVAIETSVAVGDANATIGAEDRVTRFTTALTAARTATLPAANAVNAGSRAWVFVQPSVISGTNTITVQRAGTDTLQGVPGGSTTSFVFSNPKGGFAELVSNGSNAWHLGAYRGVRRRMTISVPATALVPLLTTGPSFLDQTLNTKSLWFDPTAAESAFISIAMPQSWDAGTLSFRARWRHAATTVNFGVHWNFTARAYGDNEALTTSLTNVVGVDDTGGVTDNEYVTAETSALTPDGTPSRGERLNIAVGRDPADVDDNLAVDAGLTLLEIFYSADEDSDHV